MNATTTAQSATRATKGKTAKSQGPTMISRPTMPTVQRHPLPAQPAGLFVSSHFHRSRSACLARSRSASMRFWFSAITAQLAHGSPSIIGWQFPPEVARTEALFKVQHATDGREVNRFLLRLGGFCRYLIRPPSLSNPFLLVLRGQAVVSRRLHEILHSRLVRPLDSLAA